MTTLITGGTGFLGSRLVKALIARNQKVRVLARRTSNLKDLDPNMVEIRTGDLSESSSIRGLLDGVESVIHCAAKLDNGSAKEMYAINSEGTENLLIESARSDVKRFVHVSSVAVMSEYRNHFDSDETAPYASWWAEPYTPSKIEGEKRALAYRNQMKVIVIRPGWIWGPGDNNTAGIGKAIMSGVLPVVGSGDNVLSLTYIDNIVHALLLAESTVCETGNIFIVADEPQITQKQFLRAFADRLNPDAMLVSLPFSLAYHGAHACEFLGQKALRRLSTPVNRHNVCVGAKNFKFNLEKAKRLLGYIPTSSTERSLDETVKWIYDMHLNDLKSTPRISKVPAPLLGRTSMAHFAICSWCNAKCVFCSYPDSTERTSLKFEDAVKALNALKRLGVGIISLTGGEPFLNRDIFRIACHASSIGMIVFTGTNGSIMTEDDAFRLRRAGVRAVWLSYEGSTDGVFDKNRGVPGLSDMIRSDLKWLRQANVDSFAICVLNKSISDYREFIDHLIDLGFDKVKFDYPMTAMGSSYLGFKDVSLVNYTPEEMRNAIEQIIEIKKTKYRDFGIINPIAGLEGALKFFKGEKPDFSCSAGHRIFYIDWNLDLFRCTSLPEKFGKVWDVTHDQLIKLDCNKCYYQGTRDYDSIYQTLDSLEDARAFASKGELANSLRSVLVSKNLTGIKSIFEIASI